MGERLRLKASVDISRFPRQARRVARAMKTYGVIVADNGSDWFISGAPDRRWNNDQLHALDVLSGRDFEVVDTGRYQPGPRSATSSLSASRAPRARRATARRTRRTRP